MSLIAANDPGEVLPFSRRSYLDGLLATWWSVPRALEVNGRTFAGGVSPTIYETPLDPTSPILDSGGVTTVVELGVPRRYPIAYGHSNDDDGAWWHLISDDHNTPAMLMETDRPPLVFTSHRPGRGYVIVRRGVGDPLDLSSLGPEQHIDLTSLGGQASYAQPFRIGTNEVVMLCRVGSQAALDYAWALVRSTDWGETWTSELLMTSGEQGYILATRSGSTLHCAAYGNPVGSLRDLRTFQIDLNDGTITSGGSTIANLDGTNLPFTLQSLHIARLAPPDTRTRLLDVSPTGQIAYATWSDNDLDSATYHVLETDTSESLITTAGTRIGYTQTANYLGGMVFDGPDTLWLSRNDNAGEWVLVDTYGGLFPHWRPTGYTWMIERWTRTEGVWSHTETVATSTDPLVRPVVPAGWTIGPRVLWHRIRGEYTGYRTWTNDTLEAYPALDP